LDSINKRISDCITASGLTKTAFAERLNISQPFISRLANGEKSPSDRTIADICREFGVNEIWLRTGEGEMFKALDREQEIAQITADLFQSESDSFKFRLVKALMHLGPDEWDVLEKIAREIAEKKD
jgi:transcriptional regulator with XRE-family HTH domain